MIFNIPADLSEQLKNINLANVQNVTTASENINNYTTGGIYYFSTAYTPSGKPDSVNSFGFLVVVNGGSNARLVQIWIDTGSTGNAFYFRSNSTNIISWNDWKKVTTNADLESKEITATIQQTLPTGITSIDTVKVLQSGNVVQVFFSITRDSNSITNYVTIATGLPNAKKIYYDTSSFLLPQGLVSVAGTQTGRELRCIVDTAGKFLVSRGETAGSYIGSFSYIADDI